ncbi:tRNA (adenosine(37)-N6)-threonylcarbamoyltransferase complex ATPase subunit type 1 TsaE [Qipengyuania sp.]|uniref:tRNA (adenosine(37)-N6)-threonylcarbamoyltransferase complex ATPase subunit type 1 TsaE n=1 Tax=Qipengyuania sp. TaxID=2004515 RepID=UPI0035C7C115
MIIDLPDIAAMQTLGRAIAAKLQVGDIVALEGPLGVGKTTLARAVLAAAGHEGEVPSPSYNILETYQECQPALVHADFYRLDDPEEAEELGLDDYLEEAALIAEWPSHAGRFLASAQTLWIVLESVGEGRRAIVKSGAAWQGRWP